MKKLVAAAIVIAILLVAWWWTREPARSSTKSVSNDRAAAIATSGSQHSDAPVAIDPDAPPAWLAQAGVASRRIAGRVTFRGAPVANATVELATMHRTTNAAGEFDFGSQRAMAWNLVASATGKASARLDLDTRDPRTKTEGIELELGACDAAMFGIVRDASGGPIAKARVDTATTDDKGAYELCIETRWPGWVTVDVSADGYAAITARAIAPGRIHVDFALVPEAIIVGHVIRDDNGAAVPNAYVFVPATRETPLRYAYADATGHFRIERVSAGHLLVSARAEGLAESATGTRVVVGVGQTSSEIELRLEAGSTISGRVVDDGKAIAGARVTASTTNAISQNDGSFVLSNVPRGELRFGAAPYEVVSPKSFVVSQPAHEGVDIEVDALGAIVGLVVRNNKPVPNANLYISGPNDRELPEIRSHADGRFEARGLQPGPWTLYADDTRAGAFGRAAETVQLGRGETKEITIDVAYAASIAGRVIDQAGAPVPNVTVFWHSTKSDDGGLAATTDDGTYKATNMTGGGSYRATISRTAFETVELKPVKEFPVVALADGTSAVTGVDLVVQLDHATIAGKVVDESGAPVADVRVIASLASMPARRQDPAATSTVEGRFSIDELPAGAYALHARAPSGLEAVASGVRAGRTDVTLVIPTAGEIEVATTGFSSTPSVSATRENSAPFDGVAAGASFAIRNLSPGRYTVVARTSKEAASAIVDITSGKTTRITLAGGGTATIAGRVREFRSNKPVVGMTCRALPRIGNTIVETPGPSARSDATGSFTLEAPAGEIAIACDGLWRSHSDGLRLIAVARSQRVELDVPVVALTVEPGTTLGGIGADFDHRVPQARLIQVVPNGPAAVAGFLDNDIVTMVDAASVVDLSQRGVWSLISNRPPGTKVKVAVNRNGKTIDGEITLGEAPR